MKNDPLVSVLMPAYNHEAYVGEAIESVLQQTYSNIELLICDDSSSDRTPMIIQAYADRYPERLKLYKGKQNRGVSNRFNYLCSNAKGRYIIPFASDDQLPKDGVEKRVCFLESNPEIDVVATDISVIDQHGKVLSKAEQLRLVPQFNRLYRVDFNDLYNALLQGNFIPAGSLCIRLQRIKIHDLHHDEYCHSLHDYDVWLKLAQKYRWSYLSYPTFLYRWHGKNLSSPQNQDLDSLFNTVSQSIYILTKQLLNKQSEKQRMDTLKNIVEYCKALSGFVPKMYQDKVGQKIIPGWVNNAARIKPPYSTHASNEDANRCNNNKSIKHNECLSNEVKKLLVDGNKLLDDGRLKESCDTFIQVIDIDPANLEAFTKLGMISMQANDVVKAKKFFKRAIEIDASCEKELNALIGQV